MKCIGERDKSRCGWEVDEEEGNQGRKACKGGWIGVNSVEDVGFADVQQRFV
jgi:hypothetical protein